MVWPRSGGAVARIARVGQRAGHLQAAVATAAQAPVGLGELSQRESTPFAFAYAGSGSLLPTREAFTAAAVVKDGKFVDALTYQGATWRTVSTTARIPALCPT